MLAALAWRNIWRQPIRTTLSLIGLAFSSLLLVFMLSFQFGVYDTMKIGALGLLDGFGQFQPEGYDDDPDISRRLPNWQALATAAHSGQFEVVFGGTAEYVGAARAHKCRHSRTKAGL